MAGARRGRADIVNDLALYIDRQFFAFVYQFNHSLVRGIARGVQDAA
jgi:hypothetical protein